jgi:hypothetical protein
MEKGLEEVIDVFQAYVQDFLGVALDTILLPFRLIDALLR